MPGVPPDALPKLKGFLKNMLRGGGKKKQQQQGQRQQQYVNENTKPPTPTDSATFVLPAPGKPITSSTAPASSTIPATADYTSSKEQGLSQEAPQKDPTAITGAAPDPNVAGGPAGAQKVREQEQEIRDASTQPPLPPQDPAPTNTTFEPKASTAAPTTTPTTQHHMPVEGAKATAAETEKVDSVSEEPEQALPTTSSTATKENTLPNAAASVSDEKMPVMAEPPVVNPVKAAPGMSATSGPLEDFPGGMGEK